MGRSISERILELEKDPKKKEALDKARAKIKLWIEEGALEDHIQIDVVEWCLINSIEIKENISEDN